MPVSEQIWIVQDVNISSLSLSLSACVMVVVGGINSRNEDIVTIGDDMIDLDDLECFIPCDSPQFLPQYIYLFFFSFLFFCHL